MSKHFDPSRRTFIKTTTAAVAAAPAVSVLATDEKVDVWVIHGSDPKLMMTKAMSIIMENGGFGKNVKNLTLKVNAGWGRTPDVGANTNPELVDVFLAETKKSGVEKIVLPEHPCSNGKIAFDKSGIGAVAKKHKCKMIDLKKKQKSYREVQIPGGRKLKNAEVASEFLDADAVVNIPVAKHHGGAMVSSAMKNWMGAIKDRKYWHRTDLHQCIADFCTFMRPDWTIIDATRCMLDHGPQGPAEKMAEPNLLIVSRDQVAADAYAIDIFGHAPADVKYLKYAAEMGIGVIDQGRMNIHKIEAV